MSGQQLGALIRFLGERTVDKKRLETDLKLIESEITSLEREIMIAMDSVGVEQTATTDGKVSLKTSTYPKIEVWPSLESYILASQSLVLLEKRVAVTPYREYLSLRREVPGVVPVNVRKLTYRPLNNDDRTERAEEQPPG